MPFESQFQPQEWLTSVIVGKTPVHFPGSQAEWRTLLETAFANGVVALCHYQIAETPIRTRCPDWFYEGLKKHTLQVAASEMAQSHELKHVLAEFTQAGVSPLLIKGAALSYSLYPQPYLRERCDTDMLICIKDISTVFDVMYRLNYQYHRTGSLLTRQISFSKMRPNGVTYVLDIHWRINNRPLFQNTLTYAETKYCRTQVPGISNDAFTLSLPQSLLLACLHRAAEGTIGDKERLLWLYDIHLILSTMAKPEYKSFIEEVIKKRICAICINALNQCVALFSTKIPGFVINTLSDHSVSEPSARFLELHAPRFKFNDLINTKGLKQKWTVIHELLFPPSAYMLHYKTNSYKIFLPVYYAQRFWRGLRLT